jgi:hypothetical protein
MVLRNKVDKGTTEKGTKEIKRKAERVRIKKGDVTALKESTSIGKKKMRIMNL